MMVNDSASRIDQNLLVTSYIEKLSPISVDPTSCRPTRSRRKTLKTVENESSTTKTTKTRGNGKLLLKKDGLPVATKDTPTATAHQQTCDVNRRSFSESNPKSDATLSSSKDTHSIKPLSPMQRLEEHSSRKDDILTTPVNGDGQTNRVGDSESFSESLSSAKDQPTLDSEDISTKQTKSNNSDVPPSESSTLKSKSKKVGGGNVKDGTSTPSLVVTTSQPQGLESAPLSVNQSDTTSRRRTRHDKSESKAGEIGVSTPIIVCPPSRLPTTLPKVTSAMSKKSGKKRILASTVNLPVKDEEAVAGVTHSDVADLADVNSLLSGEKPIRTSKRQMSRTKPSSRPVRETRSKTGNAPNNDSSVSDQNDYVGKAGTHSRIETSKEETPQVKHSLVELQDETKHSNVLGHANKSNHISNLTIENDKAVVDSELDNKCVGKGLKKTRRSKKATLLQDSVNTSGHDGKEKITLDSSKSMENEILPNSESNPDQQSGLGRSRRKTKHNFTHALVDTPEPSIKKTRRSSHKTNPAIPDKHKGKSQTEDHLGAAETCTLNVESGSGLATKQATSKLVLDAQQGALKASKNENVIGSNLRVPRATRMGNKRQQDAPLADESTASAVPYLAGAAVSPNKKVKSAPESCSRLASIG